MKNLIIATALTIAAFSFVACNNTNQTASSDTAKMTTNAKPGMGATASESVKPLLASYLQLKNALAKDNSNDAATAGKALAEGFGKFNKSALTEAQKKSFTDIADDAHEMSEHIGESAGKLPHQREHFDMLSKDMYDLIKLFGAGQALYVDHCPMYNNKKGAIWLSETKDIKNPYMGAGMSTCGSIKEELK
ncbi:Protein of unknown function [Mucilaginibacter gossypiicola]|uniref:DUF3347 domain-containing protein n=1 Tax=Mucilaginibacter gossypiicola TaxID=551995 RepID=A0A1H8DKZ7_9SPHI|nr:DUF3347 domain-containing protein [Mucilaginibacter gossypiicola]SEN07826.1 Protein of unknown function [Mucilaginibacter gossypiicola]